ncbi:MAG: thioredoxin fold domain-containing protein [Chromatiales bacterium]|nr:thioredoxin fold domain-containing protein [Chromatiales bacterium]
MPGPVGLFQYCHVGLLCALAVFCAGYSVAWADPPENYPFQSFDKAMHQARSEGRPLFVYFGRYGCGYCEKTNKEAFSDAGVRQRYAEHYALAYVDAESGKRLRLPSGERITERELGTRYQAFVTPVFSFLTPEGEILGRMVGVQSKESLLVADDQVQAVLRQ